MKLPKLYRPINIKFWSLRNGLSSGLGVIYDIDTEVSRKCMRVRIKSGWKWQICGLDSLIEWDYFALTDQDTLDNYLDELEFTVDHK